MLQQLSVENQAPNEQATEQSLTPEYVYGVIKRRLLHFVIPFALVFGVGAVVTAILPATYLAEGKMLIESQEIPSNLVQPTVSTIADERVALLKQRITVRDRLLTIANKYQLPVLARQHAFLGRWRPRMSETDIVDMMRERTQIAPVKNELPGQPGQRPFIAFTVSFEHEQPEIARQVTNELVTTILDEDVRSRTSSALETTRFLERESKRLENELGLLEIKIAEVKDREARAPAGPTGTTETQLAMLKYELLMKAASYSDTHPDMKVLKERITALQKLIDSKRNDTSTKSEVGLDAFERQYGSAKKDLDVISQKLATARLGENLERGQHSERLSVIEQPTLPQKPVRPNRPKMLATFVALAIAAGGGLVFALEMFDDTIRRNADITKLIDSQLIVSIPYISTKAEVLRQKSHRIWLAIGCSVIVVLAGLAAAIYLLRKFGLL